MDNLYLTTESNLMLWLENLAFILLRSQISFNFDIFLKHLPAHKDSQEMEPGGLLKLSADTPHKTTTEKYGETQEAGSSFLLMG